MKAREIKNALFSGQLSLSESLRCAQELLVEECDSEVLVWIKNELDGYASDAILPEYRKIPCEVYVEYEDPIYGSRVVHADVQGVSEKIKQELCTMYVAQGVRGIEAIICRKNDEAPRVLIKDGKLNIVLGAVYAQGQINKAYQQTKVSYMKGILDAVRKQLINILSAQI
ncbi:MAG: hypothetical protein K6F10_06560 [Paludibacteraceae bacterium]|nr:hypothetical protein [Paludibacteraceae bacterium]